MRFSTSAMAMVAVLATGAPDLFLDIQLPGVSAVQAEEVERKGGFWQVGESVTINASPEIVFDYVVDLKKWSSWTNWGPDRDPEATWTYSGPEKQVGYTMVWVGPELGEGKLVLADIAEDKSRVVTELYFDGSDKNSPGWFSLAEVDGTTELTWYTEGKLGLFGRLFRGKIEKVISRDFSMGLQNLKVSAEADQEVADAKAAEAAMEAEAAKKAAEAAEMEAAAGEEAPGSDTQE